MSVAATGVRPRAEVFVRSYEHILGTSLDLKILAASDAASERAAAAVTTEIDRQASILSGYDPSSEFSRWMRSRNVPVSVSPELFDVLQRFDQWRERTGGALDASAETVLRVWKASETAGRLPSNRELSDAVDRMRQVHWRLDPAHRTATRLSDAPLVLNTFTKSYIVERAAESGLQTPGVRGIVVNIGGDLVTRGDMTETVAITDPQNAFDNAPPMTNLVVHDRAVATSGGYHRGFDINGTHYSHIVDPRNGRPTGHVLSATVVAGDAADAGALATAFCVLTPQESERLSREIAGAEYLLVLADGSRIESAGWRALTSSQSSSPVRRPPAAAVPSPAEPGAWNPDFALTVTLELTAQKHRQYVAVWIENSDRFPVRTLGVWHLLTDPTWDYKLKEWLRADRQRMEAGGAELLKSVSSATRGPGVHTITWNGKNNVGQFVKAGTYTVFIEVMSEGGTYQIMRQPIDFAGVAKKVDLGGNVQVSAASLDYHRVSAK